MRGVSLPFVDLPFLAKMSQKLGARFRINQAGLSLNSVSFLGRKESERKIGGPRLTNGFQPTRFVHPFCFSGNPTKIQKKTESPSDFLQRVPNLPEFPCFSKMR